MYKYYNYDTTNMQGNEAYVRSTPFLALTTGSKLFQTVLKMIKSLDNKFKVVIIFL